MTNLNTPATGVEPAYGDINLAIIGLTNHVHAVMDKHVTVLERAERTTSTLVTQLLQTQAENAALRAKLREVEDLFPKLRSAEEARDWAEERCKKTLDELDSTKLEIRNYLNEHRKSCLSCISFPPVLSRSTKPLRDCGVISKSGTSHANRDGMKNGKDTPGPSAK